ncbi:MAG TPA: carbonic anhydrase [Oscillatoriaceae cyanobacterium M33_DOE_052]|uniref:carbonic anhydrase n=1 Tax=Planktothricoides sp. SpSt-374 TaxID=2282167 RepID=A0A7C3VEP8_9CYAN|nr:carbonic anhydrase [Oscillatoriaceae cyanobacterium M33_DOE_052]
MKGNQQNLDLSRRNLLKFGALALGTGAVTTSIAANLATPQPAAAQNNITPDEALQKLMEGNKRFVDQKRQNPNQNTARLTEVARGQNPFAAILSCADSRVPTEIVFDQGLGDLFVVREAGNIATAEETGSLEFGTAVLGAKVLMVIGHEACGAVQAALQGSAVPGQIGSILAAIKPALANVTGEGDKRLENAIKANVMLQMQRLQASPVIQQLVKDGKLKVVGAYYDLDTGVISLIS